MWMKRWSLSSRSLCFNQFFKDSASSNKKRLIPNLFIIGASKCATTSLWQILGRHQEIYFSDVKEPSHFVQPNAEEKREDYLSLFQKAGHQKYVGEASPIYSETTLFPEAAKRIFEFNPEAKFIYSVRHPIDRLLSVWVQNLSTGHWYREMYDRRFGRKDIGLMPLSIEDAILHYPSFIEASRYWTHLRHYLSIFPAENIHLVFFEDFVNEPKRTINKLTQFLSLEDLSTDEGFQTEANTGQGKKRYPLWFRKFSPKSIDAFERVVPASVRGRLFKRIIKQKDILPETLKKRAWNVLKNEIDALLQFANKDGQYWKAP